MRAVHGDAVPQFGTLSSGPKETHNKVRLSDSGYTLVAKGAEAAEANLLRHERHIYDRLRGMQGIHIPVCLGILDLALPFYFDGRICTSFRFASYAGQPLNHITAPV